MSLKYILSIKAIIYCTVFSLISKYDNLRYVANIFIIMSKDVILRFRELWYAFKKVVNL